MAKDSKTYQELSNKLDDIIVSLEDPTTTIDDALSLYKEADQLIKTLKDYLENTRNEIKTLTKHSTNKEI
jgi:exodeoxyribonuclease VII small subunit